jgi:hypothetical protein
MKIFLVLPLIASLSGCALFQEAQKERQLLFAPEGLPSNKQVFAHNYSEALKAVDKGTATPAEMVAYVDAGNALLAKNCTDWMDRLSLKSRGIIASDHNLAIAGGLVTTILGALKAASSVVMGFGAAQVALQGFSQNIQTDVLGAPSQFVAQNKILELQSACGDALLSRAKELKFSQAYLGLEKCARICSHDAASEAVTQSLRK